MAVLESKGSSIGRTRKDDEIEGRRERMLQGVKKLLLTFQKKWKPVTS